MPTIPTIPTTTAATTTGTTATTDPTKPAAKSSSPATLGKDDFLKLLVGQLKNQDPMNPSSDTDFIGQMTQFSQLEQTTNMASANDKLAAQQSGARAVSLLGRTISYPDPTTGVSTSGVVDRVEWSAAGLPTLTVGGVAGITPDSVTAVQ
jgi:flagellar basal-body rod modification protein FlgD